MKILYLLLGWFLIGTSFTSFDCPCSYTGTAEHKRNKIKNRIPQKQSSLESISFKDILKMKITKDEKKQIYSDENEMLEREKKIISITGYAWIIKLSEEDCDIHIELSENNSVSEKRIIAEIPNTADYCKLHERVLHDLISKFHLNKKNDYRFDKTDNGGKAIKLTVTGFLFWDSGHPTNKNHGSKQVGTVWEIHPLTKLEWE